MALWSLHTKFLWFANIFDELSIQESSFYIHLIDFKIVEHSKS
jgi:hypothetical protein